MLEEVRSRLQNGVTVPITVWDVANEEVEHTLPVTVSANLTEKIQFIAKAPASALEGLLPNFQFNTVVGLTLEKQEPVYIVYPRVIDVKREDTLLKLWLGFNEQTQIETIQRRRHVRIPMSIPVQMYSASLGELPIPAQTINVSGGGIKLASPRKFMQNQILSLRFQLDAASPILNVKAKVILSAEKPRVFQDMNYTLACSFFELGQHEETLIMKECFRRELGMKKKP